MNKEIPSLNLGNMKTPLVGAVHYRERSTVDLWEEAKEVFGFDESMRVAFVAGVIFNRITNGTNP